MNTVYYLSRLASGFHTAASSGGTGRGCTFTCWLGSSAGAGYAAGGAGAGGGTGSSAAGCGAGVGSGAAGAAAAGSAGCSSALLCLGGLYSYGPIMINGAFISGS